MPKTHSTLIPHPRLPPHSTDKTNSTCHITEKMTRRRLVGMHFLQNILTIFETDYGLCKNMTRQEEKSQVIFHSVSLHFDIICGDKNGVRFIITYLTFITVKCILIILLQ